MNSSCPQLEQPHSVVQHIIDIEFEEAMGVSGGMHLAVKAGRWAWVIGDRHGNETQECYQRTSFKRNRIKIQQYSHATGST
jgi:hypothetical protein